MKDILFYIFGSITVLAAFCIAFSVSARNSTKAVLYLFSGIAGLLILLNFHLYSLLTVLVLLIFFSVVVLLKDRISGYLPEVKSTMKVNVFSILLISIMTAVSAALLGAAKWPMFEVHHELNSLSLIFTKYIAAELAIGFLVSVVISSALMVLKNGKTE